MAGLRLRVHLLECPCSRREWPAEPAGIGGREAFNGLYVWRLSGTGLWPGRRGSARGREPKKLGFSLIGDIASAACNHLLKSLVLVNFGAREDSPSVRNDQLPVLSVQEGSSDLTRPDDEVP